MRQVAASTPINPELASLMLKHPLVEEMDEDEINKLNLYSLTIPVPYHILSRLFTFDVGTNRKRYVYLILESNFTFYHREELKTYGSFVVFSA